jgi:hypothetical protein
MQKEVQDLDRQAEVKIKVVGCWDTVGSLGVPENALVKCLGFNRKDVWILLKDDKRMEGFM